jgi:voltage-gated sodium channel
MTIHQLRHAAFRFTHHPVFHHLMVFLIVLNAVLLGLETSRDVMADYGEVIHFLDHSILSVFVVELILLIFARGVAFFQDPWCIFDLLVIGISFVPASDSLSVLRSLRVLRVLRLINKITSMRKVVRGLLGSLSSLGSVMGLLMVVFYVSSVIVTNIFGATFPEFFGDLPHSLFTLFQVMTLEGWSGDVARPVMEKFPYAWVFFVMFILCATFVVINLFIAVIVDSLTSNSMDERRAEEPVRGSGSDNASESLETALLKEELAIIKSTLLVQNQLIESLSKKLDSK